MAAAALPELIDFNPIVFMENQCKIMNFHDFASFLGNLGVNLIHPPSSAQAYGAEPREQPG
jgi:hypothetical protein